MRHHHRLHRHILQPCLPHQLRTPSDGSVQLRRTTQPLSNVIAQIRQRNISIVIRLRRLQNFIRVSLVLRRERAVDGWHRNRRRHIGRTHLSQPRLNEQQRSPNTDSGNTSHANLLLFEPDSLTIKPHIAKHKNLRKINADQRQLSKHTTTHAVPISRSISIASA
jgi:hypothetical protein